MRIVPQSATASYSPLLALPAPQIAGLLPARCERVLPAAPTIIIEPRRSGSRVFRSFAEWDAADAEIEAFLLGARQRLASVYADVIRDLANYSYPTPSSRVRLLEVA